MPKTPTDPLDGAAWRIALGIGALYAVVGVAWIMASDALVQWVSTDPAWLAMAQRAKGILYVAVTALGLILLVRAGYLRLLRSTEQARAREAASRLALARQEEQFHQLHQSLAEVLWLAAPAGRPLLYLSPGFEQLYGRPRDDFVHDPQLWLDTVHPQDRGLALDSRQQLTDLGQCSSEYRICRPDGSVRWIADRKKTIVDEQGRVVMIGGIAEDITARKERDAALATTQAELERMVAERTLALQQVNAELDAFTRTAAHDLRSPLSAIAGYSELLQRRHGGQLDGDALDMVRRIEQSARQMASLVSDLLSLSMATHVELHTGDVDLAALWREIAAELQLQDPQRTVRFDAPATLVVHCDPGLARPLMANLLGNAWKFTRGREAAHIQLQASHGPQGTTVTIADNGAGFDSAGRGEQFKPFQRFHTAKEFPGTGIGLATCARIVGRHGGRLWLESAVGVGTRLHFCLPDAIAVAPVHASVP